MGYEELPAWRLTTVLDLELSVGVPAPGVVRLWVGEPDEHPDECEVVPLTVEEARSLAEALMRAAYDAEDETAGVRGDLPSAPK